MVLCGDAPLISGESIVALRQLHDSTGAAVTMQTIELPDGAHYGRVVRDASGQVAAVVQAKDSAGPARPPGHPGDQHRGLLF